MSWTIDLESATVSHPDGWVFRFSPVDGDPGAFDGECIGQPEKFTAEMIASAARLAREAGEAFIAARRDKQSRDKALQELADEAQRLGLYQSPIKH